MFPAWVMAWMRLVLKREIVWGDLVQLLAADSQVDDQLDMGA
jgi:hypothetical protein